MEKQPQELLDDVGVALPFVPNLKAMAERLRDHTEFAAEPLVFTQKAIFRGIKRAKGYASSLVDLVEYGDNYPAEPAMTYARIESKH